MALALTARPRRGTDTRRRAIVRKWRELTGGGGRTLIACSGGADSSALAIALAARADDVALGHVMHDIRPREEVLADRDAVQTLAAALGLAFSHASAPIMHMHGNVEANARRGRYRALEAMAIRANCAYVATAHHADDVLETMLMALVRGAGLRGLAGCAPSRRCGDVTLVRPMLDITHADARAICTDTGWVWREDATNSDTSRLRNAIRHEIAPLLTSLRPGVQTRASSAADLVRQAHDIVDERAQELLMLASASKESMTWGKGALRAERPIVIGAALRSALASLCAGRGLDRVGRRVMNDIVRAICDGRGDSRTFVLSHARVLVSRDSVRVEAVGEDTV